MKLWLKVSLISTILVTAAIGVCSVMMLISSGKSNLDFAIGNTLANQQVRAASWNTAIQEELANSSSASAERSLARFFIDKYADSSTILETESDCIYNRTSLEPQKYLPLEGSAQQYIIEDIDGKTTLITGSRITVDETDYCFYVISDLTAVYDGITQLSYRFSLMNCIVIIMAAAVTVLLVKKLLSPITTLKRTTSLIADGVYDKRIEIHERDEVGELADDFNTMANAVDVRVRELKDEAERRTLFMSALTHELKTPMTSIKGNAQTILATKIDDDERDEALMQIDHECSRIERLSGKLMQLIVLKQNNDIELKPQSVAKLIDIVERTCAEQLKSRGLMLLVTNHMDTLKMDADLLSGLLINLIDNAGKASKPGDTIELSAKDNIIAVIDHGCGIPAGELCRITQPFYIVDKSRAKKAGGIGLGLALGEEVVRLHSAHLEFESELGRGTTAKVVFNDEKKIQ